MDHPHSPNSKGPCSRRKFLATAPCLLLLLCVLLGMPAACGGEADQPRSNEAREDSRARAKPVSTVVLQGEDFRETATGVGSLASPRRVQIAPELNAILATVHVAEGAAVRQGERLYTLESDTLRSEREAVQAALEQARAEAENARVTFRRFEQLYETRTISRDEFDERATAFRTAQAEVERLQAELRRTRQRLEDTTLRAPMDGVIDAHQADPGDYVEAGETLTTLYQTDPLEIEFTVAETFMGRIRSGQAVEVRLPAQGDEAASHHGEVTFVAPNVAPETRQLQVKARVQNGEGALKPGAFAHATVILDVREDRPAAPERALAAQREGYALFVVENGKARRRDVVIGLRRPGLVEIVEGAAVGEQVVVEGHMRLADGDLVRDRARSDAANSTQEDSAGRAMGNAKEDAPADTPPEPSSKPESETRRQQHATEQHTG